MTNDFPKVFWHNLIQKPIFDRIFYVPFWECPYNCDFCCVDSLPGKPEVNFEKGEKVLFDLIESHFMRTRQKLALHYYGGEPLLKPDEFLRVARAAQNSQMVSKIYLYSTLKPRNSLQIVKSVPRDFIRVVVNDYTADEKVLKVMKELDGIAEFYDNPVVFHTGRARGVVEQPKKTFSNEKIKKTIFEKVLPISFPGRSCFANASGPLLNVAHERVHLCCLPQSPVVGGFEESTDVIIERYLSALSSFHKKTEIDMKKCGTSHACTSCEKWSQWDTAKIPTFSYK